MRISVSLRWFIAALSALIGASGAAQATNLAGAWASNADVCGDVFAKQAAKIVFRPGSDLYGGGFIVVGRRALGQMAQCSLNSIRQVGSNDFRLRGSCTAGVTLTNREFNVRVDRPDHISVTLGDPGPGMTSMAITYTRCPL